jgi:tRNA(adenine34) deaminase
MWPDWVFDDTDRQHMAEALSEAQRAAAEGEVPVGAVVVRNGTAVAQAHNRRHATHRVSAHAELVALDAAGASAGDWRLDGATVYVTLEPCPMCVAACRQARVALVVWGAADPVAGALGSVVDLATDPRLGPELAHRGGLAAEASADLLRSFFAKRR